MIKRGARAPLSPVLFLQPALGFQEPLRSWARDRSGLLRALLI
jgi:hypothetical protein